MLQRLLRAAIVLGVTVLEGVPARGETAQSAAAPRPRGRRLPCSKGVRVPAEHIVPGGPKRDEIQAIDAPRFVSLEEATWVLAESPVLGVSLGRRVARLPGARHRAAPGRERRARRRAHRRHLRPARRLARRLRAPRRRARARVRRGGPPLQRELPALRPRHREPLVRSSAATPSRVPLAGRRLRRVPVAPGDPRLLARAPPRLARARACPRTRIDYRYSPFTQLLGRATASRRRVDAEDPRFHAKEVVLGVVRDGKARAYLGSLVTAAGGSLDDEFAGRKIRLDVLEPRRRLPLRGPRRRGGDGGLLVRLEGLPSRHRGVARPGGRAAARVGAALLDAHDSHRDAAVGVLQLPSRSRRTSTARPSRS